jgi:superfamily II DNA or RNA helicase
MSYDKMIIGGKNFIAHAPKGAGWVSVGDVLSSWQSNPFSYPESDSETKAGFRSAQLGAIFAIKSHWTVSTSAATIVMPTGTGKTETMIATVVSECRGKTCIVVPSDLLRKQTVERFCLLGKLRDLGAVSQAHENPIVACLYSVPKDNAELQSIIDESNIIVATISLLNRFSEEYLRILATSCDTLLIDEAHHIAATSWMRVKEFFENSKCLQFTATPFRNDGKKIDGKIIYNFPLLLAQKQGYFKPINFYPIYEFDDNQKDLAVAKKAVEILEADIQSGKPHLLLVRASTQKRAKDLFDRVYKRNHKKYNPVLIVSGNKKSENKIALQEVNNGNSKIIICVDMFSEGIDIPQLKICANHDKYKSLPITMQFIGRFARTQANLGEASVIANIVDDDINDALQELYSQDSDWNRILKDASAEKIGREEEIQQLAQGFTGTEVIPFNQIRPKVSMFMYITTDADWHWHKWNRVFNEEHSHHYVNQQEKILIITELNNSRVDWTTCKDVTDTSWNLHILYWNQKMKVFFINTTDKRLADRFAEAIFPNAKRVRGEEVFRCLSGINRLMFATVGLNSAIAGPIRYKMFAGVDVATGLSEATKSNVTKSNLFGVGYEGGNKISIGCSYKGTIWAKWVENIDYWKKWCDHNALKILDPNIDVSAVLNNALVPEVVTARPPVVPYNIEFPVEIELNDLVYIKNNISDFPIYQMDITLTVFDEISPLNFKIGNDQLWEEFTLVIDPNIHNGYNITHRGGSSLTIVIGRREGFLKDYLREYPPRIRFVDMSSLEGNLLVRLKNFNLQFPSQNIVSWNWEGVDIRKESQGQNKATDSIQYRVIQELKAKNEYCLILDDDDSGEIADVIAIKDNEEGKEFLIEFYHCKFSGGDQPGARVSDLYVVCGQAEKCIKWVQNTRELIERLKKRENVRINAGLPSRFEVGDLQLLHRLKNKVKFYSGKFQVFIVQPGVDGNQISQPMHQVLCSASSYLKDTYNIELKLICS